MSCIVIFGPSVIGTAIVVGLRSYKKVLRPFRDLSDTALTVTRT
jgi:hypothetical protein